MTNQQNLSQDAQQEMQKAHEHTQANLKKMRVNRIDEDMLSHIKIDYYGVSTPLNQVATVKVDGLTTLRITPWEKKMIPIIEHAIHQNNPYGLSTRNDKEQVSVKLPTITQDIRQKLVKQLEQKSEQGRVAIRNIRKKFKEAIKNIKAEDEVKRQESELQKMTDKYIELINTLQNKKKQDLMKV